MAYSAAIALSAASTKRQGRLSVLWVVERAGRVRLPPNRRPGRGERESTSRPRLGELRRAHPVGLDGGLSHAYSVAGKELGRHPRALHLSALRAGADPKFCCPRRQVAGDRVCLSPVPLCNSRGELRPSRVALQGPPWAGAPMPEWCGAESRSSLDARARVHRLAAESPGVPLSSRVPLSSLVLLVRAGVYHMCYVWLRRRFVQTGYRQSGTFRSDQSCAGGSLSASALAGWLGWIEFRSAERTDILSKAEQSTVNGALTCTPHSSSATA
jgi:hypothetical protein